MPLVPISLYRSFQNIKPRCRSHPACSKLFGHPKRQVKIIHNSQNSRDFPVLSRQASTTRHTHGRDVNDAVTGTTTTQAARRGIQSMRVSCGKVTTKCQESGVRTVKACPRGHDDSVSHTPRRAFYQQTRWRFATLLSDFQRPRHKLLPVQGDTRK